MRGHQANPTPVFILCYVTLPVIRRRATLFLLTFSFRTLQEPNLARTTEKLGCVSSAHDTAEDGHALRCGPASMLHPTVTESSLAS